MSREERCHWRSLCLSCQTSQRQKERRLTVHRSRSSHLIRCLSCGRRDKGSGGSSSPEWSNQDSNTAERIERETVTFYPTDIVSERVEFDSLPQGLRCVTIQLPLNQVHPAADLMMKSLDVLQQVQLTLCHGRRSRLQRGRLSPGVFAAVRLVFCFYGRARRRLPANIFGYFVLNKK